MFGIFKKKKKQKHQMPEVNEKVFVQAGLQVLKGTYTGDGWFDCEVKVSENKTEIRPIHTVSLVCWNNRL